MTTISLRFNESDADLIRAYAAMNGMTVSDFARRAMLERIEDEFDLNIAETALAAYKSNPVTYSMDDVAKELGL